MLTLLEGLAGVILTIAGLPLNWAAFHKVVPQFAHAVLLTYFVGLINLAFAVTLFIAGTLLWMLRRRGLFLVAWTLVAEIVYFCVLDLGVTMYVYRKMGSGDFFLNFSLVTLGGNAALAVQLTTAFPVMAAILIFLAYRYLGIPARSLSVKVPADPYVE